MDGFFGLEAITTLIVQSMKNFMGASRLQKFLSAIHAMNAPV